MLHYVILKDALYVPSFHKNILSLSRARKNDNMIFDLNNIGNETMITREGTIFEISTQGHLYLLQLNHFACNSIVTKPITDWHRFLGHGNLADIAKLPAVSNNMRISAGNVPKSTLCEICVMGKATQRVSKIPDARGKSRFDSVYCDINGPIVEDNDSQFKYVLGVICDFSQHISVYLMKTKDQTPFFFKQFLADISPYGRPRKLRTDYGKEFTGKAFQEIILNRTIRHEKCAPYSAHQIGHIERSWRTLFNTARTILYDSGVPHSLWPYAVEMSAYLMNRRYQPRIKLTPLEKGTGKRPDFANLHLFGSKCYAYVQLKTKLEPRSVPAVFLGYDEKSPAYNIYFPDTGAIKKVREVVFTDLRYYKCTIMRNPGILEPDQQDMTTPRDATLSIGAGVPPGLAQPPNQSPEVENEPEIHTRPPSTSNAYEAGRYPFRSRSKPNLFGNIVDTDSIENYINDVNYVQCLNVNHTIIQVPNTYNQAMKSTEREHWIKAMDDEMSSLIANKTYDLVPTPPNCHPIGGRWVFSVKNDQFGNYKFKARFVAKGFKQIQGINYDDTFAPTARMTSIRLLMVIAIELGLLVHQMDVCNAYLNSELPPKDRIFMTQPDGYVKGQNLVCKLNKSLYGLKQSAFLWNNTLIQHMQSQNLTQSVMDPCVFVRKTDKDILYILIWVDDIIIAGSSIEIVDEFKTSLANRFKVKDLGPLKWFLGMQFDITDKVISMNQSLYVKNILTRFNMTDCSPRTLPCDPSVYTLLEQDSDPFENPKQYQELVGSLIYLMTGTRPDIAFVTTLLSRFMQKPTKMHMTLALGVLRYLKYTPHFDLRFVKTGVNLQLFGYSDSDYASDPLDRKSVSGYCFKLNKDSALVSWRSGKQSLVATSSCESEYMALFEATKEALNLRQLFSELTKKPPQTVKIYADNQGSIALAKHPSFHKRTKHINMRFHAVRDYVANNSVYITYIPSKDNTADMFTKPLAGVKLNHFSSIRGGAWKYRAKTG